MRLPICKVGQLFEEPLRLLEHPRKLAGIAVRDAAEDVAVAHAFEEQRKIDELLEFLVVILPQLFERGLESGTRRSRD